MRSILLALLVAGVPLAAAAAEGDKAPPPPAELKTSDAPRSESRDPSPTPVDPNAYRLNHGDALEFSVRGFAELRTKAVIEIDGAVTFPLAGRVKVVGLSMDEAQAVIKRLATQRPLQVRTSDGRESYLALAADDVLVTQAEYRPIYVMGDIARPGELGFRPGMTVRQAIALGGGFDIMRYRLVNPFTETTDLKSQHEVLWTKAAHARVQLKRIEAELDDKTELAADVLEDIPLDRSFVEELMKTENETLKRRRADYAKELEHMRSLIDLNVAKVETLKKQLDAEVKGTEVDQQELDQMKDAQRRGNLPLMRLMEIRRIQLTNATRVLQTRVQYDQAERDLSEAQHAIERFRNKYRTELLAQRQDQMTAYNALVSQISANSEKLVHTSLLKSRLVRGAGAKVKIAIHRALLDKKETISGNEDSPLLPGDTVEVMLEGERDADEIMRRGNGGLVQPSSAKKLSAPVEDGPAPAAAPARRIDPRAAAEQSRTGSRSLR